MEEIKEQPVDKSTEKTETIEVAVKKTTEKAPEVSETVTEKAPEVSETETKKVPEVAEVAEELAVFPAEAKVTADETDQFDEQAKALFKQHEGVNSFCFTSDGLAFFQHSDARNHGLGLEDKIVITKTRI